MGPYLKKSIEVNVISQDYLEFVQREILLYNAPNSNEKKSEHKVDLTGGSGIYEIIFKNEKYRDYVRFNR